MIIEETDFRLTSGGSNHFWDLDLLYTVKPKGGPEREEFKDAGYGMPLKTCMQRIIHHRITYNKEIGTLKGYIQDYKEQVDKLDNLFKDM